MSSIDPSSNLHLIQKPTELSTLELENLLDAGCQCIVHLKDYLNLKNVADKMIATSKALDILLGASLKKNQEIQSSCFSLDAKFRALVELRDDVLFVSVRELEEGIVKTLKILDEVREEFKDGGMTEDNFSEALTLIHATLEDCEPETYISQIFEDLQI